MTNSKIKNKSQSIEAFFKVNKEYIGYGIYVGKK